MQDGLIVLILIRSGINTWQVIAVEDHRNGLIHLVKLIKEIRRFLVGPVNSLGIGVDIVFFALSRPLRYVGINKLVIVVEIAIRHMVLHGYQLQELRIVGILLLIQQIDNALIGFAVAHVRGPVNAIGVLQWNLAIKRV